MKIRYASFIDLDTHLQHMLQYYTRDDLRAFAKKHNIPRGRNKIDTVRNICKAKVLVDVELAILDHQK